MDHSRLEAKMIETGYPQLMSSLSTDSANPFWGGGKHQELLQAIIADTGSSSGGRFLAAEVLRYQEVPLEEAHFPTLAQAYTEALASTSYATDNPHQLDGNAWGLLYEDEQIGHLGAQLLAFGNAAVPYLLALLDDTHGQILYIGSEEATIGNAKRYRIKDMAAYFLSRITGTPIRFFPEPAERDAEIERFKIALAAD
jgi:hypothetical protein